MRRIKNKKFKRTNPLIYFEKVLWSQGIEYVAGVDEVGLGALAGPVVACAVIFPKDIDFFKVKDSKKLTIKQRESLYRQIKDKALCIGIGEVSIEEINRINNIYRCGLEAMRKAVYSLKIEPQHILVDAREIPDLELPQSSFKNGEDINFSIAAASIVAKVYRDDLMKKYAAVYPEYRFEEHKGYATSFHIRMLKEIGPSKIHRTSYDFIKGICGGFSKIYFEFNEKIKKASSEDDITLLYNKLEQLKKRISPLERTRLRAKITSRRRSMELRLAK